MKWTVVRKTKPLFRSRLVSALGSWDAAWNEEGLFGLSNAGENAGPGGEAPPSWLVQAWKLYWEGKEFEARLCTLNQPTTGRAAVWGNVLAIPWGATLSYAEVGFRSGMPGGARAVGAIMRANPWALFLPCHRVIGKDGSMRGYGGTSGIGLKARLIAFEREHIREE